MKRKKVAIVGAGPGGLAAAMLLTAQGYDVEVYEKRAEVGGRNSGFKLGGYSFDLGPTFFLMKDVLEDIFARTGRKLSECVDLRELQTMYRLRFKGNRELVLSRDPERMKASLEAFCPGAWEGYRRYLREERVKYDKLIPCLALPYESVLDLLKWRFVGTLPWLDAHLSLNGVLSRYFPDPETRIAFTFQAKYIGMSPWEAPGTFSIISFIEHGGGIFHVQGGLNRLSQAMAKAVADDGGKIFTSAPVRRLIIEGGAAKGLELEDGTRVAADHVVLNADFAHAMTALVPPEHRRKYTDEDLARRRYSCSTFMLYLGVNRAWPRHPHHNIIFADDYRANVEDISSRGRLSHDQSFYVQNPCVTDPGLAPAGRSALYVLAPVPNNSAGLDWKKEAGPFRERLLELMETRGGFDGLRGAIEEERVITPDDWQADMDVYKGAVFNLSHHLGQMLFMRPHNRFEEFRNCWLVGGGTHPGSGLPTIYESARISAELIARQDRDGR